MWNSQDTFETLKRSFISAFSVCMNVPLNDAHVLLVEYNPIYFNIIEAVHIKLKYLVLVEKGWAIYGGPLVSR